MILNESQRDRDVELAAITGKDIDYIETLELCSPEALLLYDEEREDEPTNKTEMEAIYQRYIGKDVTAYLRTLMYTSVERRHPELWELINNTRNKECLDFGSGVGTHSIALCENENKVTMLDVPGPLSEFAMERMRRRGFDYTFLEANEPLSEDTFDVVLCSDVLEHVYSPVEDFCRIERSLKAGGMLHLLVSAMIKPRSGHFSSSIQQWEKDGIPMLKKYFKRVGKATYRKKRRLVWSFRG